MLRHALGGPSAALLTWIVLGATPSPSGPVDPSGKYQLAGTAHVSVSPFPSQDYPGEITATLARSRAPDGFALRVEARGYGCTFQVVVGGDGSLKFPGGERCPLEVSDADARGHLEARLRSARGRAAASKLELALQLDVDGTMRVRIPARTIRILGAEVQTPATWAPSAPVHGTVSASASGPREVQAKVP